MFFGVHPDGQQLEVLDRLVRVSQWLLSNPKHSTMKGEAKNFAWKKIKELLDEVVRHPEMCTETFRPLRIDSKLREDLIVLLNRDAVAGQ